jgi:hypothetical protein
LLKTLRREDLSADIAAYDDALIAQREAEVIARDAVKATNDSKLKAKKKISNKGRGPQVRTAEQKAAKRLRESSDEQKAAKRLRDSKRVRTDEHKAAKRLRDSKQKAAKRLRDGKRVRTAA